MLLAKNVIDEDREMKRIAKITIALATIFGVNFSAPVHAKQTVPEKSSNKILERVVIIQETLDQKPEFRRVLDKLKISQWANFPNWPNWGNWYNY